MVKGKIDRGDCRKIKPSKRIRRFRIIVLIFFVALIVLLRGVLPLLGIYLYLPKLTIPFLVSLIAICLIPAERAGPRRVRGKLMSASLVRFSYVLLMIALIASIPASFYYATTRPISPFERGELIMELEYLIEYDNPAKGFHQESKAIADLYGRKTVDGMLVDYFVLDFDKPLRRWVSGAGFTFELEVEEMEMWFGSPGQPYEGLFVGMNTRARMGSFRFETPAITTYIEPLSALEIGQKFSCESTIRVITGTGDEVLRLAGKASGEVEALEPVELPFGTFESYRIRTVREATPMYPSTYQIIWVSAELCLTVKSSDHGMAWDGVERWTLQSVRYAKWQVVETWSGEIRGSHF